MFYNSAKITQWGKETVFSTNSAGTTGYPYAKKLINVGSFGVYILKAMREILKELRREMIKFVC